MNKRWVYILSVLALCQLIMACSEVNFTPETAGGAQSLSPDSPSIVDNPTPPPIDNPRVKDVFFQNASDNQVDILVLIDNSPSMFEEQQKIGETISSFFNQLGDVDWQVGITTTDISGGTFSTNGDLLKFDSTSSYVLTKAVPDYKRAFLKTITRKESDCYSNCASSNEQPLRASMMAMDKRDTQNQGFFRPGADLALVIISDEDEMSTGPAGATTPNDLISHFGSIWGSSKNFAAFGIVIVPGDTNCFSKNTAGGGNYGDFVSELTGKTGGLIGSICDSDFGPTLSKIGKKVSNLLTSFELSEEPLESSIQLTSLPQQSLEWHLESKRIIFKTAPSQGTKIEVSYLKKNK
ncbi:MAG: hypothetical protein IPL83_09060 [Bdellovibrionales bacterium]|nr:hypothetical protein [Bdellovibrionales bacterium]